ncbi:rhomboid family intramembrane serine protease, partial [Fulvivirga sp. RKSG066]|uniref:rhomboid family intramembrane serine protease n=1 Tax=Fulvivirga aurantia TaxID=2529383 RepID=UPI0012BD27CC
MNEGRTRLRRSLYATLSFVVVIWLVKLTEFAFDIDLTEFGILPRSLEGSVGIITGPLVHGDIFHLLSNTFPILVLGVGLFYFYDRIALHVIVLIYLITGFWVWIAARDAYHVGASGLVYGLLTFLLFSGFFRKDSKTLSIS